MRNILFIIFLFGILSVGYADEKDISASQPQKESIELTTESPGLSPEIIATIFGVISAGFVTLIIKFGEWYFSRKTLITNLRKGLYFEIENHKIIELDEKTDDEPNFALASFIDIFYHSNLSNITKNLNEELTQQLIHYYSHLKIAFDFQSEFSLVNEKLHERLFNRATIGDKIKTNILSEKKKDLMTSIRMILATAQYSRNNLLDDLRCAFKKDPSSIEFINVLPKYKDWFETIQKNDE